MKLKIALTAHAVDTTCQARSAREALEIIRAFEAGVGIELQKSALRHGWDPKKLAEGQPLQGHYFFPSAGWFVDVVK